MIVFKNVPSLSVLNQDLLQSAGMEQVRVRVSAKLVKSQISIAFCLTLFGTEGDTFIPLSFFDKIWSVDFSSKISKLFWR